MDILPDRIQHATTAMGRVSSRINFEITYKPGKQNLAADALSRKVQILAISIISNPMLQEIQEALPQDPYFGEIIMRFPNQETQQTFQDYSIKEGLLHFRGRLCVPTNIKNQIMKEAHEAPLTAHLGYHKMFATLKQTFFWPRMKKDTLEFTRKCLIC